MAVLGEGEGHGLGYQSISIFIFPSKLFFFFFFSENKKCYQPKTRLDNNLLVPKPRRINSDGPDFTIFLLHFVVLTCKPVLILILFEYLHRML